MLRMLCSRTKSSTQKYIKNEQIAFMSHPFFDDQRAILSLFQIILQAQRNYTSKSDAKRIVVDRSCRRLIFLDLALASKKLTKFCLNAIQLARFKKRKSEKNIFIPNKKVAVQK